MAMLNNSGYFQWYNTADQANLIRGMDISNPDYPVNWTTAYNAGARFIYMKTGGYTYNSTTARYLRVSATGNSTGTSVIVRELEAYSTTDSSTDIAKNKAVTTSSGVSGTAITDGSTSTNVNIGDGYQWAVVDLGSSIALRYIKLLMYAGVSFHGLKLDYSADNVTWTNFYDSAVQGEYVEPSDGMLLITNTHNMNVQSQFTTANISAARSAGHKVGYYWFKNPNYFDTTAKVYHNTVADAEAEAQAFKDQIDAQTNGDYGDVMPMLDWENNLGSIYPAVTNDGAYNFIEAFCNKFKALTGRQVIVYSAYYTNETLVTGAASGAVPLVHSTKGAVANITPMWLSAMYGSGTYPSYNYTEFGGYDKWTIWQDSTDGNAKGATFGVAITDVDLDYVENMDNIKRPVAPSGVNASAGDAQVTVNWTASANTIATGYKIYRNSTLIYTTTDKTLAAYVDNGVTNGTVYNYTVTTTTVWEESTKSPEATITPQAAQSVGSIYTVSFEGYSTGVTPSDWTPRWTTAGSVYQAAAALAGSNGQVLQSVGGSGTGTRRAFTYNPVDTYNGDWDMLVKWRSTDATAGAIVNRNYANLSGDDANTPTSQQGYNCYFANDKTLKMGKYLKSEYVAIGTTFTYAGTYTAGDWMWTRFNRKGNNFSCKIWKDGELEPTTWQNTGTDSGTAMVAYSTQPANAPYTGGWYGVGTGPISGEKDWDFFGLATGVSTVPNPSRNAMKFGSLHAANLKMGTSNAKKIYKGTNLVWSASGGYRYVRVKHNVATNDSGYNEVVVNSTAGGNVARGRTDFTFNPPADGVNVFATPSKMTDGITTEAVGSAPYYAPSSAGHQFVLDLDDYYSDLTSVSFTVNSAYQLDVPSTDYTIEVSQDNVNWVACTYSAVSGNTVTFNAPAAIAATPA